MKTILEVDKINKKYGKKQVLFDVSFSLKEGEILGFIGPNGAGKTTSIKLILGLQSMDSGTVTINGFDVKKDFVKAIDKVGAIVENPDMYMYLTGRKNLELIKNSYKGISEERIEEVIKLVGLENRIDDKVSKYSLGMRQRLGIAASLINNPNLLILDEPTNGLDPEGIKDLRDLLKKLAKKEHIAILISSHNLSELESFCSNVCIIKNGKIITTTTIEEIRKNEIPTYIIHADKTEGLEAILKEKYEIQGNFVRVERTQEEIAETIKDMVNNNYKIYEVRLIEMSLEDAFLLKTGGNVID